MNYLKYHTVKRYKKLNRIIELLKECSPAIVLGILGGLAIGHFYLVGVVQGIY